MYEGKDSNKIVQTVNIRCYGTSVAIVKYSMRYFLIQQMRVAVNVEGEDGKLENLLCDELVYLDTDPENIVHFLKLQK